MMIPAILIIIVILVFITGIRLLREFGASSAQTPARPLNTIERPSGKTFFSLDMPSNTASVSLAPRMDIDVEAPHSLVGAEFSGSMAPVKETVQEVLISPVKEPLKDGALFIDERLKFEKLEQMIGEKNKEIESLKKDLEAERTTRGEFETLRKTFQEQIEELKLQNRRSKADLQAAVQENVELKKSFVKEQKSVVEEYIRAEVDTAPDIILDAPMENRAEVPLKDIFNQNNIKKEGNV